MSYRKNKNPKHKGFEALKDLKITSNAQQAVSGDSKFTGLIITEEIPSYLKSFPQIEELRELMEELQPSHGINIPIDLIQLPPTKGWTMETQREVISSFNYAVRTYGESLGLNKKFGTKTLTYSGKNRLKSHDLAQYIRLIVIDSKVKPKSQPYVAQKLTLRLRKDVYLYLKRCSALLDKPMTGLAQEIIEERIKQEKLEEF